jgi:hypothetical protein
MAASTASTGLISLLRIWLATVVASGVQAAGAAGLADFPGQPSAAAGVAAAADAAAEAAIRPRRVKSVMEPSLERRWSRS